jgi:hypothetical protein
LALPVQGNNAVSAVPNEPLAPVALAAVLDDQVVVHEVHGDILTNYFFHVGGPGGPLGYPLTDESGTPDGVGRFNHFQNGSIYWTPTTGAVEVHGAIYDRWASLGWEKSYMGHPIRDEHDCGDGARCSTFQHGWIRWTPTAGAIDTSGVYYVHLDSFNIIKTRSLVSDSDQLALVAKVQSSLSGGSNNTADWGPNNLGDGTVATDLVLGPYTVPPDSSDQLGFSYVIVNNGGSISTEAGFTSLGEVGLGLAGEAIGTLAGPGGSTTGKEIGSSLGVTLNDLARKFLNDLTGLLAPITAYAFADCDGLVAQDEIAYTGAALATATGAGPDRGTQTYSGSDSAAGCGSNSIYSVSWSVSRG